MYIIRMVYNSKFNDSFKKEKKQEKPLEGTTKPHEDVQQHHWVLVKSNHCEALFGVRYSGPQVKVTPS